MFHRPKPEAQNETDSSQTKPTLNASPVAAVATEIEATETTSETTSNHTNTGNQGRKETVTMNKEQDNAKTAEDAKSVDIPQTTTSSPFQRPTQAAPATASKSSYGSYNPAPYGSAGASTSATTSPNGRRLVIGEGITMSGEIESCDHLLVEGSVEAALKGAKALEISETGKFYGTVDIENATIAGHFEGEINVTGRLTVASTGVITGSIAYGELQIEAGATLDGRLAPIGAVATASKKVKGKATAAKPNEAELPLAS